MRRFGVGAIKLTGVKVSEKATGIGSSIAAPPAPAAPAAAARSENVGARLVPKIVVSEAEAKTEESSSSSDSNSSSSGSDSSSSSEAKPLKKQEKKPSVAEPSVAEPSVAEPSVQKPPVQKPPVQKPKAKSEAKLKAEAKTQALLEGALSADEWKEDATTANFTKTLKGPNPVEITAPQYTPVSSPEFPDFIVQTYMRYSPYLQRIVEEGAVDLKEKEVDRDACKRRNPEKRELFYYQKFIRDYLSRGTPYRGLLVYHGLGSGKTCASIAAAEALYYGGQKTIFILTPATLSNNYRKDIAKCGFYPLRQNNFWQFLKFTPGRGMRADNAYVWLTEVLGLPPDYVEKQGGGWVATPEKPTNWTTLSADQQTSIKAQQAAHMEHRFKFIHYNGATAETLATLAANGVKTGKQLFDNAVVVIDEVHNLVRTINGTQIGGKPISTLMVDGGKEPREATWSTPLAQAINGYRYPRAYTLYRLLQNAVGAKVIVLSATPMINYAQEMAILLNIIGGEQRMAEIPLDSGSKTERIKEWIRQQPDVDYAEIEEGMGGKTVLSITPVPFGFSKVVSGDYSTRGFVRVPGAHDVRTSRERTMDVWAASLSAKMLAAGLITKANTAIIRTFPLLPDDATDFVNKFIDKATLKVLNANILKARASGLVSYYRGGSEELMPRVGVNQTVEVPMSDYMFKEYSRVRLEELDKEGSATAPESADGKAFDLYTYATKSKQTGFLSQSRAACNWVFPEDAPRPKMDAKQQAKLRGVEKERIVAVDMVEDVDVDVDLEHPAEPEGPLAVADEVVKLESTALDAVLTGILGTMMSGLEANAERFLREGLPVFSPKYAAMITRIRASPGPVLVYSQFKRLEGLGIFAAALRAADEKYLPLDIQKVGGQWEIPAELMVAGRPRYIMYTGDQDREKRRLLLQLYNADVDELPTKLAAQCRELLAPAGSEPAVDNRDGRVCRVFMITQSGAEGISLSNTRQVHIMEPYWNNVRLQQVIGRAIRLCSHMNLPWDDRVVDIFTYLSVFSPEQLKEGSKQLMMSDKSMTTDQIIFDIATRKQVLADELAAIMQSAAVDCQLHFHEHGEATQCFKFKEGARPLFMYHPNWRKDSDAAVRAAV